MLVAALCFGAVWQRTGFGVGNLHFVDEILDQYQCKMSRTNNESARKIGLEDSSKHYCKYQVMAVVQHAKIRKKAPIQEVLRMNF